jgi:hypothetical protein
MENQNHLLETIGPMYVEELKKKQAEASTATTIVDTSKADEMAEVAETA